MMLSRPLRHRWRTRYATFAFSFFVGFLMAPSQGDAAPVAVSRTAQAASVGQGAQRAQAGKRTVLAKRASVRRTDAKNKSNAAPPKSKKINRKVSSRLAARSPAKARRSHRKNAPLEDANALFTKSSSVLVQDADSGTVLYQKRADDVLPIASITKLMTAMVTLDSRMDMEEIIDIGEEDVDSLKGSHSRLPVGTQMTRELMLNLALMSSENRAANALSRHFLGGRTAFVAAMNRKAVSLGMHNTHFEDPTGLTPANVSTARDLTRLVSAAYAYPLIREFSTALERAVDINGRTRVFHNSNALVRSLDWEIEVSKTGYIREAGRCVVMRTWLANKPTIIVLLDSASSGARINDAARIKRWTESASLNQQTPG
jgi:D-alanyl-D-alanine endopeptidase (penicillin-binding protein 7)